MNCIFFDTATLQQDFLAPPLVGCKDKKQQGYGNDENIDDCRQKNLPPRPVDVPRELESDEQDLQRAPEGEPVVVGVGFSAQKITT